MPASTTSEGPALSPQRENEARVARYEPEAGRLVLVERPLGLQRAVAAFLLGPLLLLVAAVAGAFFAMGETVSVLVGALILAVGLAVLYVTAVIVANRRRAEIDAGGIRRRSVPLPWIGGYAVPAEDLVGARVIERVTHRGGVSSRTGHHHVALHAVLRDGSERVVFEGDPRLFPRDDLDAIAEWTERRFGLDRRSAEAPDPTETGVVRS